MSLPKAIQQLFLPALLSFATLLPSACQVTGPSDPGADGEVVTVTFTESTTPLVNPERGFYGGAVDIFSASNPVKAATAKALRAEGKTLMYVGFYLTDFMKGDISQAYLDMVQKSLDALREAGIKCVLRFAYQNSESNKPWDPSVEITLRHVSQLKPILQKNADVIFVLQAGFVGVWGEWYYTDNFIMNPSSNADYQPRRQLADALLDALPENESEDPADYVAAVYTSTLSDSEVMRLTFTPGAGCSSNRVTAGPWAMPVSFAEMPKLCSVSSSCLAFCMSRWPWAETSSASPCASRSMGG